MSVVRIDNPAGHTHGWQARAHLVAGQRLTKFFADDSHGGVIAAMKAAHTAEVQLQRKAKRLRAQGRV